ncbi:helix-turn-helix domain-containing protein [Acaryochloris marina]|uniref:Transcriptional regulator, AraC family n=1 Tax=Acaryochloris marina (strain MBIC 11017) TaxID=329726 RepID=B0C0J2_ACAM1|nr:AraC family transcriptional regulator [Acaryochloris marina]ABW30785.1 transcriptional regulator, AraC family [Acaryochloris marina MBIC11017]BDM79543.1 AraC family transcriptional regulator [Acaryochloris marina MBIC10699]
MADTYQSIYPSEPLLRSGDIVRPTATELLSLEYFEAEPDTMPTQIYEQHHILINLKDEPHRVENWRDDQHRDFIYRKNEIVVTPAGVESGWRWYAKSKVIVITLKPDKMEQFAQNELGVLLNPTQLSSIPQFIDEDLTEAGVLLLNALQSEGIGSAVMFESLARVFLVKLIQKYGLERDEEYAFTQSFTAQHYKRVLDYIADNFGQTIMLEDLAGQASLSTYHFSRLFKQTIGQSPHQFVMTYRIEQAKKMLATPTSMIDIALRCGFADQAHFSRVFKKFEGQTPKAWRKAQ